MILLMTLLNSFQWKSLKSRESGMNKVETTCIFCKTSITIDNAQRPICCECNNRFVGF